MSSVFSLLQNFTFFSITYETLLPRGFIWNEKKHFYLIWCWFIFYLIDKGFCSICEFVFCNKLDRIRRQNFGAKVALSKNIPKSNNKHLTQIRMFTDPSFIQLSRRKIYMYIVSQTFVMLDQLKKNIKPYR